jgi:plastocyanin
VTKARVLLAGLLVALSGGLCVPAPPASAATRSVHLTNDGPSPASLTIASGDRVVFVNDDRVPHEIRSQEGWQYDSGPLPPGQTSDPTPPLTAPGTYRYLDLRGIVVLPQTFGGRIVVPKPAPKPTPSPTGSSPAPSPRPSPSATPRTSPSASLPPSPSATPSVTPTLTPRPLPSATPASPAPLPSPLPTPRYGDPQALVQSSPHRYGLPALVAGILIGGVLSLLARYLLSLPEGRRTGSS